MSEPRIHKETSANKASADALAINPREKQAEKPSTGLGSFFYRVKHRETFGTLLEVIAKADPPSHGRFELDRKSYVSLTHVLQHWLEKQGQLGPGAKLSSVWGQSIWVPDKVTLIKHYDLLRANGMLPDDLSRGVMVQPKAAVATTRGLATPRAPAPSTVKAQSASRAQSVSKDEGNAALKTLLSMVTRAIVRSAEYQRTRSISSTEVFNYLQGKGVPYDLLRDALVKTTSLQELAGKIAKAAAKTKVSLGLGGAEQLARMFGDALAFKLLVRPLAERLREEVATGLAQLTALAANKDELVKQAKRLFAMSPAEATKSLAMLGLAAVKESKVAEKLQQGFQRFLEFFADLIGAAVERLRDLASKLEAAEAKMRRLELFKLAPAITRTAIQTAKIGLDPKDFPFENKEIENAAQEAVLDHLDKWDRSEEKWVNLGMGLATGAATMGLGFGYSVASAAGSAGTELVTGLDHASQLQALADRGFVDPSEVDDKVRATFIKAGIGAVIGVFGGKLAKPLAMKGGTLAESSLKEVGKKLLENTGKRLLKLGVSAGIDHLTASADHQGETLAALEKDRKALFVKWREHFGEEGKVDQTSFAQSLALFARFYRPAVMGGMSTPVLEREFLAFADELVAVGRAASAPGT